MTVVDPATGELVFTNAGHNPPLLVRASGGFEKLAGGGVILGILPMAAYQESRAQMQPGDVLVLFSDGVTEAANPPDEDFGEERLAELVASMRDRPAVKLSRRSTQRWPSSPKALRRPTISRSWSRAGFRISPSSRSSPPSARS